MMDPEIDVPIDEVVKEETLTDEQVRAKAIAAFRQRDDQRLRAQSSARADYRATFVEALKAVFGSAPDLPEEIETGKSIDVYGLHLGLNPESHVVAYLACSKCRGVHPLQLSTLADAGRVYSDTSFIEKTCKGRPKDFEGDLLLVLGDIRDTLAQLVKPQ